MSAPADNDISVKEYNEMNSKTWKKKLKKMWHLETITVPGYDREKDR